MWVIACYETNGSCIHDIGFWFVHAYMSRGEPTACPTHESLQECKDVVALCYGNGRTDLAFFAVRDDVFQTYRRNGLPDGCAHFIPTKNNPTCPPGLTRYVAPDSAPTSTPEETMPKPISTPVLPTASLASVSIKRNPDDYKLYLYVDARPLHDLLEKLGVPTAGGKFTNRPPHAAAAIISEASLSTELFLRQEYPVKLELGSVFSVPPPAETLTRLCDSAKDAVRKILTHYQPIDIRVSINKKVVA